MDLDPEASRVTGPLLSGSNLSHVGDHNQRVMLQAIRVQGPVTRIELAATTGLTAAAVAIITNRLLEDQLILVAGKRRGERGQPAAKLAVNPDGRFSIGLNIDRDHITLIVLDLAGNVRARTAREIAFARPAHVRTFYQRTIRQMLDTSRIARSRLAGVGVAFPDEITGAQLAGQPDDYAAWSTANVADLIRDVLGIPVYVENDAAAAAIGEMQFGLGRTHRSFFYLLVTAALGGGLVANGSYFRGANGRSGEIGLLRALDASGQQTEMQKIVSLSALYQRLAAAGFRVASPRGLTRLAPAARLVVDRWIGEATEALVAPLVAINCLINPDAIVIGGRLPVALIDRLAASLNGRMSSVASNVPALAQIARATSSEDAPAIGAAILPFNHELLPARSALLKGAWDSTV